MGPYYDSMVAIAWRLEPQAPSEPARESDSTSSRSVLEVFSWRRLLLDSLTWRLRRAGGPAYGPAHGTEADLLTAR